MKRIIVLIAIACCYYSTNAQTNRINHFSHSGSLATLDIFSANDNMGLGCGSVYRGEFKPSVDSTTVIWDSVKMDTNKVCTPQPQKKGKAIDPKVDTSGIYNRGPK